MTINKIENGTELTIALEGRLDTNTSTELEAALQDQLEDKTALIFDLGGLEYISSAGLRILLASQKKMNKCEGTMKVINVGDVIMEIFDVTGFNEILTIE